MSAIERFHRRVAVDGPQSPMQWLFWLLLAPLAGLYGLVNWLRGACYDLGFLPVYRASVPVVSVGNLAVGGTGKTPVVDWLITQFLQQGRTPAVVSRGYGGSFRGDVGTVSTGSGPLLSAAEAGDEPVLLSRRNPQVPVLIARRRAAGVAAAVSEYGADVVILDDGFQHRAVHRDVDLVLLDGRRPFGNGWPLPAGLLREFPGALKRADMLLLTRAPKDVNREPFQRPVWTSHHRLTNPVSDLGGQTVDLEQLRGKKLFAFAGIAQPQGFFAALEEAGLSLCGTLPCRDHAAYTEEMLSQLREKSRGAAGLITTEKDAVKLTTEMFDIPCYQVPLRIDIERGVELSAAIMKKLWREDMPISPELMEVLACPKCKQPVTLAEDQQSIVCDACRLRYPVRDDIPVMLIDEAESF